jgi:hypothetical protein
MVMTGTEDKGRRTRKNNKCPMPNAHNKYYKDGKPHIDVTVHPNSSKY